MHCPAGCEQRFAAKNFVVDSHARSRHLEHAAFYGEKIVIQGRHDVPAGCFDHEEANACFFDGCIRQAKVAQELGSADLEIFQVVSMVDDLHLIGIGIPDAYVAPVNENGFRSVHKLLECSDAGKLPDAVLHELRGLHFLQSFNFLDEDFFQKRGSLHVIAMRATGRLGHNAVDDALLQKIRRGKLQGLS